MAAGVTGAVGVGAGVGAGVCDAGCPALATPEADRTLVALLAADLLTLEAVLLVEAEAEAEDDGAMPTTHWVG